MRSVPHHPHCLWSPSVAFRSAKVPPANYRTQYSFLDARRCKSDGRLVLSGGGTSTRSDTRRKNLLLDTHSGRKFAGGLRGRSPKDGGTRGCKEALYVPNQAVRRTGRGSFPSCLGRVHRRWRRRPTPRRTDSGQPSSQRPAAWPSPTGLCSRPTPAGSHHSRPITARSAVGPKCDAWPRHAHALHGMRPRLRRLRPHLQPVQHPLRPFDRHRTTATSPDAGHLPGLRDRLQGGVGMFGPHGTVRQPDLHGLRGHLPSVRRSMRPIR
jgi:hypothetical protein